MLLILCWLMQSGMELRVLHSAAYLQTWYGKWGYGFGRGPFSISRKTWKSTVTSVHNTPMASVLADFEICVADHAIPAIIERYQVQLVCYLTPSQPSALNRLHKLHVEP